jgi:DeoR/GlpR family transcriptional regulator of sugar metabolism
MDFGTKTYFVAKEMRRQHLQILVAPTSMQVVDVLAQDRDIHVLIPGGEVKPVELSLYGSTTETFFREHRWDVAVVSVAGVSGETETMTDYDEADARVKGAMVSSADRVIVLAEAHHLGVVSFAPVCRIDAVDVVVTDAIGSDPTTETLEHQGIEVIRAMERT